MGGGVLIPIKSYFIRVFPHQFSSLLFPFLERSVKSSDFDSAGAEALRLRSISNAEFVRDSRQRPNQCLDQLYHYHTFSYSLIKQQLFIRVGTFL